MILHNWAQDCMSLLKRVILTFLVVVLCWINSTMILILLSLLLLSRSLWYLIQLVRMAVGFHGLMLGSLCFVGITTSSSRSTHDTSPAHTKQSSNTSPIKQGRSFGLQRSKCVTACSITKNLFQYECSMQSSKSYGI